MNTRIVFTASALLLASLTFAQTAKKTAHKITPTKAAAIAVKKYPGKVQGTPKLEHEDGHGQYEVLVKSGKHLKEVNVDADSGKIASVENTSAAEEAKEAKKGKD